MVYMYISSYICIEGVPYTWLSMMKIFQFQIVKKCCLFETFYVAVCGENYRNFDIDRIAIIFVIFIICGMNKWNMLLKFNLIYHLRG